MAQLAAESNRAASVPSVVANPAPLGLAGFALTTFVLSSINAGWFPAGGTNIVVGLALFYGGLAQLLAGMWEFKTGNTLGATAFTSYGAFWLSFAAIFIPGTGILSALTTSGTLHSALGIYLLAWGIFTFLLFLGSLRTTLALMAVLGLLTLTFLALAFGELTGVTSLGVLGGYLGILTALVAWYTALAGLLTSMDGIFTLPVGPRS
jgi:succinate-acetate transporter protein